MSIYQEVILDHYHSPQNTGRIENPTASIDISNPLCGDTITMDILIENNIVTDLKYISSGCAISIASASMLSEYVKGKTKEELQKLDKNFIIKLIGIELSPNRVKCALMPLEALSKVINTQ